MADEISQQLGFDATGAINALRQLDNAMQALEGRLGRSVVALQAFNKQGGRTVATYKQIAASANAAAAAVERLARAQGTAAGQTTSSATPSIPATVQPGASAAQAASAVITQGVQNTNAAAQQTSTIFSRFSSSVQAGFQRAQASLQTFSQSAQTNLNAAAKPVRALTVDFQTMVRIVTTQLIVRALSALRNAFRQSFDDALAFTTTIQQIRTILPEAERNFDVLADRVRSLSDAFNQPLGVVGDGLYNIISDQIHGASNQVEVLTSALQFSKIGVADVGTSAALLTGTLNAFGSQVRDVDEIAAKFFRTMDLGRSTATELGLSFGRVAPVAAQIGLSMEELQAAFAAITIGGVKTNEAATQLNGILTALLKPSDAMKVAFRELGFETGEQIIQSFGLVGALQQVISTTNGTSTAVAALIPRQRGLRGALRLAGEGADAFRTSLEAIENTTGAVLNEKFELFIETNAESVTRDLNRLRNFFTVEVGQSFIASLRSTFALTGGVDTLISAFRSAGPVITAVTVILGGYGLAAARASLASSLAANNATRLAFAIKGITVASLGVSAGLFVLDRLNQTLTESLSNFQKQQEGRVRLTQARAQSELVIERNKNQRIVQDANKLLASLRRTYFDQVDIAQKANLEIESSTKDTLDKILQAKEDQVRQLRQIEEGAAKAITDSEERSLDIRTEQADLEFQASIRRLTGEQQFIKLQQRSSAVAQQAARALAAARTDEDTGSAIEEFQRARAFAQQALSIAQSADNRQLEVRAVGQLRQITNEQVRAETQLQLLRQRQADSAKKEADRRQKELLELNQLAQRLVDNTSLFDGSGQALPREDREQRLKDAAKDLERFRELAFRGTDSLDSLLGTTQLIQGFQRAISGQEITALFNVDDSLADLNRKINESTQGLEVLVKLVPDPESLRGLTFSEQLNSATEQFSAQAESAETLRKQIDDANVAAERLKTTAASIVGLFEIQDQPATNQIRRVLRDSERVRGFDVGALEEQRRQLEFEITQALLNPTLSQETVTAIQARVAEFLSRAPSSFTFDSESSGIGAAAPLLDDLLKQRDIINAVPDNAREQLQGVNQQLEVLRQSVDLLQTSSTSTSQSALSTQAAVSATREPSEALATNAERAAAGYERAAQAAQRLSTTATPSVVGPQFQSHGVVKAMKYLASGGLNRGTDTINAKLAAGETVINARSSRRFFSQLQAINAGVTPVYRSDGGVVNNTNIGDIHVHDRSGRPEQTARATMSAIRREQRRGSSRL